jgi:hypothetical protein
MVEAKRFAQLDPSVGQTTQIAYIPPSGEALTFQDDGITTMQKWIGIFGVKPTDELDGEEARLLFEAERQKHASVQ